MQNTFDLTILKDLLFCISAIAAVVVVYLNTKQIKLINLQIEDLKTKQKKENCLIYTPTSIEIIQTINGTIQKFGDNISKDFKAKLLKDLTNSIDELNKKYVIKSILSSFVKDFVRRINKSKKETKNLLKNEFINNLSIDPTCKKMPNSIFTIWIDSMIEREEYLTLDDFVTLTPEIMSNSDEKIKLEIFDWLISMLVGKETAK